MTSLSVLKSSLKAITPAMHTAALEMARKQNPGRSEDHIGSVALDCLGIFLAVIDAAEVPDDAAPSVRRFLDCCTSNLTQETCDKLWHGDIDGTLLRDIRADPASVFLHVPDGDLADDWPADLVIVARRAQTLGCHYLCFDRDAEPCAGIPVYGWDKHIAMPTNRRSEHRHTRMLELGEMWDGTNGEDPMRRGLARDELATLRQEQADEETGGWISWDGHGGTPVNPDWLVVVIKGPFGGQLAGSVDWNQRLTYRIPAIGKVKAPHRVLGDRERRNGK